MNGNAVREHGVVTTISCASIQTNDTAPCDGEQSIKLIPVANEINAEHAAAFGKAGEALAHARRAGELLLQAKDSVAHGEWLPWIKANCAFGDRQAQRYIKLAENWVTIAAKYDTKSDLTLTGALQLIDRSCSSELERANEFSARADAFERDSHGSLKAAERILNDPSATLAELAWVIRESSHVLKEQTRINIEAERNYGRCFIELKALTKLSDDDLLAVLNDGSLMREAEKKIAEFEAAA